MTKTIVSLEEYKQLCCSASDMVKQFANRQPIAFNSMLSELGHYNKDYDYYHRILKDLIVNKNEIEVAKILRQFRIKQQVELVCCDVLGQISVEAMLHCLSNLATACLNVTYYYIYDLLAKRHGIALDEVGRQQHLTIFGMGKLGGKELNFSSDVDLIFAYPKKGKTQGNEYGKNIIDNELFFHQLAQKLIRLLDRYDENGFVYRIDMRLKPFGSVGTLCVSFDSIRKYYLKHGRNWERYALVKMRAVAGNIADGNALLDDLSTFVYQRQIDFEAVNSIEEMKRKIITKSHERKLRDNLKLGYGGIRDIEFLVQTFQIMYGGRILELREQSLLRALEILRTKNLLSNRLTEMLRSNYLRLRKIENAIQYYRDQQTHDLPSKTKYRKALLIALQIDDWQTLAEEIARIRFEVFQLFNRTFASQDKNNAGLDRKKLSKDYWLTLINQTDIIDKNAETIANNFATFYKRMKNHDLGDRYLIRLDWILPQIISALNGEEKPIKIAKHILELLEAIVDESVYLTLLVEHPMVLKKIMHLFMHSSWMTKFLCEHPRVIDELIHESHENIDVDAKSIRKELKHTIAQSVGIENIIPKLVDFKNAQMFRIASADMQNRIRLMHVSDHLTWIAEAIIEVILQQAQSEMIKKYGKPTYEINGKTYNAEFGLIAYGKLGGLEMGYASDLDIIFLHSSKGKKQRTSAEKNSIDNEVFFTRLVGKFNSYISTLTARGKLYEIDIRLRPSGKSGMLVNSLNAFENYQLTNAWTWEHQALVRSRFIAGSKDIEKAFKLIRKKVISQHRDDKKLRDSVINMREKMRQSYKNPEKGMVHVKHGAGGVTDIEFIVQYLLLSHAQKHRHLIRCSDNMRQLAALELFDILRSADASDLRSAYRNFRFWIHHKQLLGQPAIAPIAKFNRQMADVMRIWKKVFRI